MLYKMYTENKENIMSKISLLDLLQQDIEDIKGLINCEKNDLTKGIMRYQARGIILNLQEHLEAFIQNSKEM